MELAAAVPQKLKLSFLSRRQLSILPWVSSPSICVFAGGNMFCSINSKHRAVVSQETPVLLECINLKGGEVSLAEAPFIQNAVACQRMLCLSSFCDCSSDVCSSASSPVPIQIWSGVLECGVLVSPCIPALHPTLLLHWSCKFLSIWECSPGTKPVAPEL